MSRRAYRIASAHATERYATHLGIDSHPLDAGIELTRPAWGHIWITRASARATLGLTVLS